MDDVSRFILFLDNLTAQQTDEFKEAVAKVIGVNWYGIANATDLWQVVDAGIAQLLKVLTRQEQDKWLEDDENADRWYGHTEDKPFSVMERRILITMWGGEAWKKLISGQYDDTIRKCWERTGCLMTADGSEESKIAPEGLHDYKVPPPIEYTEPTINLPATNNVPAGSEDDTVDINVIEENEEIGPEDDVEMLEDKEDDRDFSDKLVGLKLKVIYENGWFTGEVIYINKLLNEYKVSFEDGSSDYIAEGDIDGIEVQLLL